MKNAPNDLNDAVLRHEASFPWGAKDVSVDATRVLTGHECHVATLERDANARDLVIVSALERKVDVISRVVFVDRLGIRASDVIEKDI